MPRFSEVQDETDDWRQAQSQTPAFTCYLQGLNDTDVFALPLGPGSYTVSVLPDLAKIIYPEGSGVPSGPILQQEAILSAWVAERIVNPNGTETLGTVATLSEKRDDLAMAGQVTISQINFYSAQITLPAPATVNGYMHTGQFFLVVSGQAVPLIAGTTTDPLGYTPDAGRYLVTLDNPTGQRTSNWGGWIDTYTFGGASSGTGESPSGDILDPNLPLHTALGPYGSKLDNASSQVGTHEIYESPGYVLDPLTGLWSIPGTIPAFDVNLSYLGKGWEALKTGMKDELVKAIDTFAEDVSTAHGLTYLYELGQTIRTLASFRQAWEGWASSQLDKVQSFGKDQDFEAFDREATRETTTFMLDIGELVRGKLSTTQEHIREAGDKILTSTRIILERSAEYFTFEFNLNDLKAPIVLSGHQVSFFGSNGDDVVDANDAYVAISSTDFARISKNDVLYGGAGDDTLSADGGDDILAGGAGNDRLYGEDGADKLWGNADDDLLEGGSGNDRLNGGGGRDTVNGGAGFDTADYSTSDGRVVVSLSTGYAAGSDAQGDVLTSIENLIGTPFSNDILTAGVGDNILAGLAGGDTLNGMGGNDTADYAASDGRVVVNLAKGYAAGGHAQGDIVLNIENLIGSDFSGDILGGDAAPNVLDGGAGADMADYSASDGRVVIKLASGYAAGGHAQGDILLNIENLTGSNFSGDILGASAAPNVLDGGAGADTADYSASPGRVVIKLATGYAAGGHAQGDTLTSIENVIGSNFSGDVLGGDAASNVLDGGGGTDTADYSSSNGRVVVNLAIGYAAGGFAQGDILKSIENLAGTPFENDILTGDVGKNTLAGLAGGDTLNGGAGFDSADYSASDGRVVVNLATGYAAGGHAQGDSLANIENVIGTIFSNDILTGGVGDSLLAGLDGADILNGNLGSDTADYSASDGRVVVNLTTGYSAGGHAQGDTLINIENVFGSSYDDILTGDAGSNILTGGAGADTFGFKGIFGNDTVTDFQDEVDVLSVSGAGAIVAHADTINGAMYNFANGSTLLLLGATVAQSLDDLFIV